MVYFTTFTIKKQPNVLKYTSPMDDTGHSFLLTIGPPGSSKKKQKSWTSCREGPQPLFSREGPNAGGKKTHNAAIGCLVHFTFHFFIFHLKTSVGQLMKQADTMFFRAEVWKTSSHLLGSEDFLGDRVL